MPGFFHSYLLWGVLPRTACARGMCHVTALFTCFLGSPSSFCPRSEGVTHMATPLFAGTGPAHPGELGTQASGGQFPC